MMEEKFSRQDLKFMALAFLFAGLAYIFIDVALSGIINIYSVMAYVLALVLVLTAGPVLEKKIGQ